MTASQQKPALRGLFYWRVLCWWLLAVVVTLTLIPEPDGSVIGFQVNDKVAHFVCYFALACGFGCLRLGLRLFWPMLLLMLLGVLLEVVQLLSMYGRMFDPWDMLANSVGVFLGAIMMLTPLSHAFLWFERALDNNARG